MPTLSTTITLSIPEGGMSLAALEAAVAEAITGAGRDLLLAGCQAMERESLAWSGSSLRHEKGRSVDLLTRFGWVRLVRWQGQERATGRYGYPWDRVLGVRPR